MVDFKRGSEKSAQQARTPALPAFLAAFAAKSSYCGLPGFCVLLIQGFAHPVRVESNETSQTLKECFASGFIADTVQ